jgi:hypothetical protein
MGLEADYSVDAFLGEYFRRKKAGTNQLRAHPSPLPNGEGALITQALARGVHRVSHTEDLVSLLLYFFAMRIIRLLRQSSS